MPNPLRAVLPDRCLVVDDDPNRRYEQLACGHPGALLTDADARAKAERRYAEHLAAGGPRLTRVNWNPSWPFSEPWQRHPTRALRYGLPARAATRRRCRYCADPDGLAHQFLARLVSEACVLLDHPHTPIEH